MTVIQTVKKHFSDYSKLLKIPQKKEISIHRYLPKNVVLIVSPHPDDEIIMGTLALRLQKENSLKVINVAVTLGSNKSRQQQRKKELAAACRILKWNSIILSESWGKKKTELKSIIKKYKPSLIIAPHELDQHPTHIKTSQLLTDCLGNSSTTVAWAEYWSQLKKPNCLVEISEDLHLSQIKALECHKGEVQRNPYHIRLLGWQIDNVRRGSEILSQSGNQSKSMVAGQIYRLENFKNGESLKSDPKTFITLRDDASDLFH